MEPSRAAPAKDTNTRRLTVKGVVQGVGFRPFVYRLATRREMRGSVLNKGSMGVEIKVTGTIPNLDAFQTALLAELPPLARIDELAVTEIPTEEFSEFSILESIEGTGGRSIAVIPADAGICKACSNEVLDTKDSRRGSYEFVACVDCGPRYSSIEDTPYDRPKTSYAEFPLCKECKTEYIDPGDRRFHAQTTACRICGPNYWIASDPEINGRAAIQAAARTVDAGGIIVVQGIAGSHLVCDARNRESVLKLRNFKNRHSKPFASMIRNEEALKRILTKCAKGGLVPEYDRLASIFSGTCRPILIFDAQLPETNWLSPGLGSLGVMLPYTGVHLTLFQHMNTDWIVATSGNPSGLPMAIDETEIAEQELDTIADLVLVHNRRIVQRIDDSVIRLATWSPFTEETSYANDQFYAPIIRRSRGYVPEGFIVRIEFPSGGLAVGPILDATGAIIVANKIIPTQHIGDTESIENLAFLRDALDHLLKIYRLSSPEFVAHDLHPQMPSTLFAKQLADELNAELYPIQHHHAHLAALAVDHSLEPDAQIVVATLDGVGYGAPGEAWGGEILAGTASTSRRVGSLLPFSLLAGDKAVKHPTRIAWSMFKEAGLDPRESLMRQLNHGDHEADFLDNRWGRKGIDVKTSAVGRLLDGFSAILGVCTLRSYKGEPAMKLDATGSKETSANHNLALACIEKFEAKQIIDWRPMLHWTLEELHNSEERKGDLGENPHETVSRIAGTLQRTIGETYGLACTRIAEQQGFDIVGISGGVAFNRFIPTEFRRVCVEQGLRCLLPASVPPGDGGVSVGQVYAAALRHSMV